VKETEIEREAEIERGRDGERERERERRGDLSQIVCSVFVSKT
jgi:hypothetical protein